MPALSHNLACSVTYLERSPADNSSSPCFPPPSSTADLLCQRRLRHLYRLPHRPVDRPPQRPVPLLVHLQAPAVMAAPLAAPRLRHNASCNPLRIFPPPSYFETSISPGYYKGPPAHCPPAGLYKPPLTWRHTGPGIFAALTAVPSPPSRCFHVDPSLYPRPLSAVSVHRASCLPSSSPHNCIQNSSPSRTHPVSPRASRA